MQLFDYHFNAMGTRCELRLYASADDVAEACAKAIIADVERLEAKYSRYRSSSDLSAINRVAATGGSITVDEETATLLDYAATCFEQSDGLFDLSSGLLRKAWDFKTKQLPSPAALAPLLARVGWQRLSWQRPLLSFSVAGMELDLGGVVKEYAADRAATLCMQHGIAHALINLGGDIRVTGPQADGMPWRIGISDPLQPDCAMQTLELRQGALASSGDYQRCMVIDGVRYGHILDPFTGWPVQGLAAVSVVADFCVVAGSASTIAMLKGHAGKAWLDELGLPYLWVDSSGQRGGPLMGLPPEAAAV